MTAAATGDLDAGAWFGKRFAGTRVPTLDEALVALGDRPATYLETLERYASAGKMVPWRAYGEATGSGQHVYHD